MATLGSSEVPSSSSSSASATSGHQELSKAAAFAHANRQTIKIKFADFQTKLCNKLLKKGVNTEMFQLFVINQFPPGKCVLQSLASLPNTFEAITHQGLWDYFHYSPLVQIVKKFCPNDLEMQSCMQAYKKDLKSFSIVTTVEAYIEADLDVADPPESRAKYNPRYYRPVGWGSKQIDHTLQYLDDVWKLFSSGQYLVPDSPPVVLLDRISKGLGVHYEEITEEEPELSQQKETPSSEAPDTVIMSDEEAQIIVDQALKSGSLEQRNTVAVVVGIVGAGKTWLIRRLFRDKPPERYTSTGIAEQAVRGLMRHIVTMESWKHLSSEKVLEILASFIQGGLPEADIASLAKKFTEEEVPEPTQDPSGEVIPSLQPTVTADTLSSPSSPHLVAVVNSPTTLLSPSPPDSTATAHPEQEKSHASETMIGLVKTIQGSKEAVTIELLHMIDTGGQPEFMEIMPSVIHNSNFTLLVLNLDQSLDEALHFALYENDIPFKRPHRSVLTNRQVIHQLAQTLQAKRPTHNSSQRSEVAVIGTHRDCLKKKGKLYETLEIVNKELKSIFLPAMEDELIIYRSHDEIIFPVNLLNPDDDDEKVLEVIRERIREAGIGVKAEIPISFSMFEHEAIRYVEEKRGKDRQIMILSFDECVQVGTRLKMSREVVRAALIFFHRHNIFLYFQHILPNLVFLAPQVPLDFVNAIVAFSYKVKSEEAILGLNAECVRFCNEGIITEEMLHQKSLQLSNHFIPNIYEPQDAIKLFLHIYAIAPLGNEVALDKKQQTPTHSSRPGQKPQRKREYLMMSLLTDRCKICIEEQLPPPSKVAPLVIHFKNNCVPNGCFGNTISCLISTYNWEVSQTEEGEPECLAHNIVTLSDPTLPVTVTMVNSTRHIEIHVSMDEVKKEDLNKFCLKIRETIFAAIAKVFRVMKFEDIHIEPGLLCPCKCSPSHVATVCPPPNSSYIICSKTKKSVGCLQKEQQFWLEDGKLVMSRKRKFSEVSSDPADTKTSSKDEGSSCHAVAKHRKESAREESWKDQADTKTSTTVTLPQLIRFRTTSGSLLDQIGTRYWDLGVLLLNDDTGAVTQAIIDQHHEEATKINREILKRWIQGQGMPVKWATLIEALRDIGLTQLACEIEKKIITQEVN